MLAFFNLALLYNTRSRVNDLSLHALVYFPQNICHASKSSHIIKLFIIVTASRFLALFFDLAGPNLHDLSDLVHEIREENLQNLCFREWLCIMRQTPPHLFLQCIPEDDLESLLVKFEFFPDVECLVVFHPDQSVELSEEDADAWHNIGRATLRRVVEIDYHLDCILSEFFVKRHNFPAGVKDQIFDLEEDGATVLGLFDGLEQDEEGDREILRACISHDVKGAKETEDWR